MALVVLVPELSRGRHTLLIWFSAGGRVSVVIEAGVVAGYVIAWAVRKARRVGGRLDAEADQVIDAGLDQLHEVVAARLAGHPVLAELVEEAEQAGEVSDLTRQQVELAVAAAARKDEAFGQTVTELVDRLREAELARGPVAAGPGSAVFTGDAHAKATDGGIAIGQAANVYMDQRPEGPPRPGRSGH
jgi:hypothetical protein